MFLALLTATVLTDLPRRCGLVVISTLVGYDGRPPVPCATRATISHMPKRISSIAFTSDRSSLIAADRFGDVHCLPIAKALRDSKCPESNLPFVKQVSEESLPILGHFSMVTDVVVRPHLVATCDRDNRIRVSNYPKSHDIQSFCLGHTAFVTRLAWVDDDRLVSGGGDGFLRLWHVNTGKEVAKLDLGCALASKESAAGAAATPAAVITGLSVNPRNCDILAATLHSSCETILITGMLRDKLQLAFRFTPSVEVHAGFGRLSGAAFDEKQRLWVAGSEVASVVAYDLSQFHGDITKPARVETVAAGLTCERDCPHFQRSYQATGEWLAGLRKKEIVAGWKGKKRRREEPSNGDGEGSGNDK
jgi:WD40 repeat protein